jgi:hypothetical protein
VKTIVRFLDPSSILLRLCDHISMTKYYLFSSLFEPRFRQKPHSHLPHVMRRATQRSECYQNGNQQKQRLIDNAKKCSFSIHDLYVGISTTACACRLKSLMKASFNCQLGRSQMLSIVFEGTGYLSNTKYCSKNRPARSLCKFLCFLVLAIAGKSKKSITPYRYH